MPENVAAMKHTHIISLFIGIFFISSMQLHADGKQKYDKKKFLKAADKAYKEGNIYAATDLYQQIAEHDPGTTSILMNLANSYYYARDYESGERYFAQAYHADSVANITALYYQALMMKMQGKYEAAIPLFNRFAKIYKTGENARAMRKWAKTEADGCKFALQEMKPDPNIVLTHLGREVNSNYAEASPALVGDKLYFASIKSDTVITMKANPDKTESELEHMKLFVSTVADGTYTTADRVDELRKPTKHITNPSFSYDGKKFFYTECEGEFSGFNCQIYTADYKDGKIGETHILGPEINMPGTTNTHPYYSKVPGVGDVLYFVSNRTGGKGGLDIWYSMVNRKGEFGPPRNAGSKINTDRDEVSPFYDGATGTLYFSSNGWISMGGLDIYKSEGEPGKNTSIENLGAPFNTSCDDFYYRFIGDSKKGYLVSNRVGIFSVRGKTCCDDIFSYQYLKQIHIAVKGRVIEQATGAVMPGVAVNLSLKSDNLSGNDVVISSDTTVDETSYFFNIKEGKQYKLSANKDGYFATGAEFSTHDIKNSDTITVNLYMKRFEKDKEYRLSNIYYDFNKWDLRDDAKKTLDTLYAILIENPTIIIELGSHTDARGSDSYNQELSQKRAEICMAYLLSKGISKDRITAKGYGKTKLLQDCSKIANCPTDQSGDCECHQLNRRTVFKITGELDRKLLYDNNE
jgi:OOP family OmpA-OmpF porin